MGLTRDNRAFESLKSQLSYLSSEFFRLHREEREWLADLRAAEDAFETGHKLRKCRDCGKQDLVLPKLGPGHYVCYKCQKLRSGHKVRKCRTCGGWHPVLSNGISICKASRAEVEAWKSKTEPTPKPGTVRRLVPEDAYFEDRLPDLRTTIKEPTPPELAAYQKRKYWESMQPPLPFTPEQLLIGVCMFASAYLAIWLANLLT